MKLLLVGATGLVGGQVLALGLADPRVKQVVAPTRRALPPHPKLLAPLVDFHQLPGNQPWWRVDAAICALGTTMKQAGTREAFYRVDHDWPLAVARLVRECEATGFVLNSAAGASPGSRIFYNRVKGELERDLIALGFPSLTLVRPGLIGGERQQVRRAEALMGKVLHALGPLLPRRMRINPAENIARALLEAAIARRPGTQVVSAAELA